MKKIILALVVFILAIDVTIADDFKIRLVINDPGYMEVQMKCVNVAVLPTTSTPISGFTFQIRWDVSLGADIDLLCTSNPYNLTDGLGAIQTTGSYNWRTYYAASTPFPCPTNWVLDQWETITSFIVTTGSGTGDFEVAPDGWVEQGLNWQIGDPVVFYNPDVISGITGYPYPTIVYDYVWVGGATSPPLQDEKSWSLASNWQNACGGTVSAGPSTSNNCYIPGGLTYYPENVDLFGVYTPAADNVRVGSGGEINWNDPNNKTLEISGDVFLSVKTMFLASSYDNHNN